MRAECPGVEDLPFYSTNGNFFCARAYLGWGSDEPLGGCNGCRIAEYNDFADGEFIDAGQGMLFPFGSVVVRPGCSLYTLPTFSAYGVVYDGPLVQQNVNSGRPMQGMVNTT